MEKYLAFKTGVVNKDFENWTIIGLYNIETSALPPLSIENPKGLTNPTEVSHLGYQLQGFMLLGLLPSHLFYYKTPRGRYLP